jgi:hypothetical protein
VRIKMALILVLLAGLLIPISSFADSIEITGGTGGSATFDGSTFTISDANISGFSINGGSSVAITGGTMDVTASAYNVGLCGGATCSALFSTGTITIDGDGGQTLLSGNFLYQTAGQGLGISTYTSTFSADLTDVYLNPLIDPGTVTAGSLSEIDLNMALSGLNYSGEVMDTLVALTASNTEGGPITAPEPPLFVMAGMGFGGLFLLKRRVVSA